MIFSYNHVIVQQNIVLNILYSCLFSLNYQANLDYKIEVARRVETNRKIDNEIIEELKED